MSSSGRSPEELFLRSGNSSSSICPSNCPSVNISCYRISYKTTGQILFLNLDRMFPSVSSCASTKKDSGPSTNMVAVGHLWFFLLSHLHRNYLTDSNETCLLCSPQCLVVHVQKTIPVRRQIWPFGSRLGLSEISHWQACHRISSKTTCRIFFRFWSQCFRQCLVVKYQKQSDLLKNMVAVGHVWFFLLSHLLRNYGLQVWKIRASPSQKWRIRTYLTHLWKIRTNSSQVWQIRSNFSHLWQIRLTYTFE